ncbi:DUF3870 domain-containing protein [Candidatus Formimonas warabiya]|uniref:DUF3870 domain-containing protein n=1 Tax=Formimonas warabiya TaxID=1761012 RepID=A0A3G1KRQ7_FORW1|nr:DUF3870 domain-containing protein [Candidatus Formimonas warabiya]ATW25126.1 hypothetical protein DCMF_10400 [Candidatus Formimonas warabiya]
MRNEGGEQIRARTVFLAGHAALPQGMAAKGPFDHLAVVVEIDRKYGVIVNAQCTLITDLANDIVHHCLVGFCLADGVDILISEIMDTYHGAAKNAIIASLKDLYREYNKYRGM